ncbi:MAG: C40 family peptidase [Rhodoferax sp.]
MQILMRKATALLFAFLFTASVHAAPADATDSMDQLLINKGLLAKIDQMRQTVGETTSGLVFTAMGFLGVPYRRGGNTVESGFDCSGFVRATFEQTIGLILPRKAEQQAAVTERIDRSDLKPGDLVFFNTMRRAFSHVGIYIGEGKFIHSPKPGSEVRVEDMGISYWSRRFDGARRVLTLQPDPPVLQVAPLAEPAVR